MLPLGRTLREPNLAERGVAAQVVDVPMRGASSPAVVGKPRREAAGPAGASNVGIEARVEFEHPEGAYSDTAPGRSFEDEDVGAR